MPSHLTRSVIRKLVTSEPIQYHGCLRQSTIHPRTCRIRSGHGSPSLQHQRTFFNIFRAPAKTAREADLDPGLEKMMELSKMLRLQARPPPNEEVADAFQRFMIAKLDNNSAAEDEQIKYAHQAFQYLLGQESGDLVRNKSLWRASRVARSATRSSPVHREFALEVFREHERRREAVGAKPRGDHLHNLVATLCNSGAPLMARQVVEQYSGLPQPCAGEGEEEGDGSEAASQRLWTTVLRQFAKERNEVEVNRTLEMMKQGDENVDDPFISAAMARFYGDLDQLGKAQVWYDLYRVAPVNTLTSGEQVEMYKSLLDACMRAKSHDWGQTLVETLVSGAPDKQLWDLVLVWAAGTGKGVDEIERMIGVLERSHRASGEDARGAFVDIETINKLVEFAISREDPYMAERFVELGRRKAIEANAKTLTLQMDYRLSVEDVGGALVAYQHLQSHDLTGDDDVPTVNRLICAMCATGRHDFESIMNVAADLSDRQVRFASQTVATLGVLHLSRGELLDVMDLLHTHAYHYSAADRSVIRNALLDYILRPSATTAQAWDAYTVVRDVFDEMDREQRTIIMKEFFRRERADMAIYVFNTMRAHTRSDAVSTIETYVACLDGVANLKDEESLDAVHNHLKLDSSIEPSTQLRNALMRTHTACDRPRRALGFWDDIASSREGPNISSIHLAFRACEKAPWGDEKAREIWQKLGTTGMDFDNTLWASYIGGLVGNGNVEGAIAELEGAQAEGSVSLDSFM